MLVLYMKWIYFHSHNFKISHVSISASNDPIRLYNSPCIMAAMPVVIHPIPMSILFEHYKQLSRIGGKVRIGRLTPLQQDQWSGISLNQCFLNLPQLFF
jgi:hypothetical protein